MHVERPADKYLLHTNSKVRPYMCGFEGCGKTYKESSHLRQHVFEHTKISEHRCTYPECGPERYFCTNTELQRHIDRAHRPKQETPICSICHRIFENSAMLHAHFNNEHSVHTQ